MEKSVLKSFINVFVEFLNSTKLTSDRGLNILKSILVDEKSTEEISKELGIIPLRVEQIAKKSVKNVILAGDLLLSNVSFDWLKFIQKTKKFDISLEEIEWIVAQKKGWTQNTMDLPLSFRAIKSLSVNGIKTVEQLISYKEEEIKFSLGKKSFDEIEAFLKSRGLNFTK